MCLCCTRASAFRSYHRSKDWTKLAPWGDTAANSPLQLIHNKAALTAVCRHAAKACRMHHHFFPFFSVLGYFPYNSPAVHHHHHHSIHSSRSFHSKSLPPPSLLCLCHMKGFRWNNLAIFTPEAPRRILCLCCLFVKLFALTGKGALILEETVFITRLSAYLDVAKCMLWQTFLHRNLHAVSCPASGVRMYIFSF